MIDGLEEPISTDISFKCSRSIRDYKSIEECLMDENPNEDPIECVYIDVVASGENGIRMRKVVLHHVGIYPSSATVIVEISEEGQNARILKDEIVRVIRRMKPWWSWVADIRIENILLGVLLFVVSVNLILGAHKEIYEFGITSNIAWLAIGILMYLAVRFAAKWMRIDSLMLLSRLVIFPQGVVAIGEGEDRLQKIERTQKTIGRVCGFLLVLMCTVMVAYVFS